ncbi:hypothetical protein ENKNEFLB_00106 [Nocardioides aquaticus]|uniref:Sulfotransferase family protein n=1 Tax=Nocardioides aquaticus TaxID=160826 RepID=A0ABX8ED25_9ACTN|nr:hypothetical protein [Nocardioides aquaticus]QVT77740.1 hypothetical protein ENKNEFLB_00106 [Nocardioides aquaticus]
MSRTAPRRVFLHVGAPKTGTTYLQDRLTLNARSLARHGVHVPTGSRLVSPALFQFRAALDLLGQDWGGAPGHAEGAWEALVKKVRATSGTVVVSHEILAPAKAEAVARAKRDLTADGSELHVVYTARDLGRQVPAAWQESIKQGRTWSYAVFVKKFRRRSAWFAHAFDLPTALGRWSEGLPPERVHLVTVPPSGTPGDLLWTRFCAVTGIDPAWAPRPSDRRNASMGAAETEVVRALNEALDRKVRRGPDYDYLIRNLLAEDSLVSGSSHSSPVRMPPRLLDWAQEETARWRTWVESAGIDVVGDLDELEPRPIAEEDWNDPDKTTRKWRLRVAMRALTAMTEEAARRPMPERSLPGRVRAEAARRIRTR